MIVISLWQPWASAMFAPLNPGVSPDPIKKNETRSWPMPDKYIGQTIGIQAAKRDTEDEKEFWMDVCFDEFKREMYGRAFGAIDIRNYPMLPRGKVIGTVVFSKSVRTEDLAVSALESTWGNYSVGRWAWPATEQKPFANPIPCVGRQGFFNWEMPT